MQPNRTDQALVRASDPASPRLSADQVIQIHNLHLRHISWDVIAEEIGTTRKNVMRIVQGRRWKSLHPTIAPELYNEQPVATFTAQDAERVIDNALDVARAQIVSALKLAA